MNHYFGIIEDDLKGLKMWRLNNHKPDSTIPAKPDSKAGIFLSTSDPYLPGAPSTCSYYRGLF